MFNMMIQFFFQEPRLLDGYILTLKTWRSWGVQGVSQLLKQSGSF